MFAKNLHIILLAAALWCGAWTSSLVAQTTGEEDCVVCTGEYACVRESGSESDMLAGKSLVGDSIFYTNALTVNFEVNKWDISDTSSLVRTLRDVIIPCTIEKGWHLDHIAVRGGASPDGPWPNNKMLSEQRTRAIAKRVMSMLSAYACASTDMFISEQGKEDYPQLLFLMRQSGDSLTDKVQAIYNKYHGATRFDEIKIDLKALDGGKTWKRLAETYFPLLRSARVMFYMTKGDGTDKTSGNAGKTGASGNAGKSGVSGATYSTGKARNTDIIALDDTCCGGHYPFVMETNGLQQEVTDSMFYDESMKVDFDMDSYEMADSAAMMEYIRRYILPCTVGKGWRIDKIVVRCAASPDGTFAANKKLAQQRAKTFTGRLKQILPENILNDKTKTKVEAVAEDYPQLVYLMRLAGDPKADAVAAVVDSCNGNAAKIKQVLKARNNGETWEYLKDKYFPEMRNARVMLLMTTDSALRAQSTGATDTTGISGATSTSGNTGKSGVSGNTGKSEAAAGDSIRPIGPISPIGPIHSADSIASAAAKDSLEALAAAQRAEKHRQDSIAAESAKAAKDSIAAVAPATAAKDSVGAAIAAKDSILAPADTAAIAVPAAADSAANAARTDSAAYRRLLSRCPYHLFKVDSLDRNIRGLQQLPWGVAFNKKDSDLLDEFINRDAVINIKTNLLFDFAYVPKYGMAYILNAQLEYYPKHGHITPVLSFDGPWWQNKASEHKYFQVRNYQAEVRWYFRKQDARYDGFYAGIYGHGMLYGIGFNGGEGYQGEGWGLGLSGGYVLPLGKHYRHVKLEFGLQVGYFRTKYDPYVYGCPVEKIEDGLYYYNWTGQASDFVPRQYLFQWFGPTRVGISISYDLLYRKRSSKGISFIWHEPLQQKKEEQQADEQQQTGAPKGESETTTNNKE